MTVGELRAATVRAPAVAEVRLVCPGEVAAEIAAVQVTQPRGPDGEPNGPAELILFLKRAKVE